MRRPGPQATTPACRRYRSGWDAPCRASTARARQPAGGGPAPARLFTDRYREGAAPGLVAELRRLMGTGREPVPPLTEQRFTVLDDLPPVDDPELTVLMEPAWRLPRYRAETFIKSTLRCAPGYQRTGNPEFLTRLASSGLMTFRVRRDPENQKALDAARPAKPAMPAGA